MSYDFSLDIDTGCGNTVCIWDCNITSNVAPMWREAGIDFRAMDGAPAIQVAVALRPAVSAMAADPTTYRAMNPDNGWGDADGCLRFLRDLLEACEMHPNTVLRVSW